MDIVVGALPHQCSVSLAIAVPTYKCGLNIQAHMACLGVEPNVIHGFTNSSQLFAQVGPDEHVVCALSGGVDSTVAATLVHKVLGNRLHCVFVDNGLLRYKVRNGDTNIWWVCVERLLDRAAHSKMSHNGLAGGVHVTLF